MKDVEVFRFEIPVFVERANDEYVARLYRRAADFRVMHTFSAYDEVDLEVIVRVHFYRIMLVAEYGRQFKRVVALRALCEFPQYFVVVGKRLGKSLLFHDRIITRIFRKSTRRAKNRENITGKK